MCQFNNSQMQEIILQSKDKSEEHCQKFKLCSTFDTRKL